MPQGEWTTQIARHLATAVRRYRKERGMSAQQLAERCADIGLKMSRSVLADLENGRRASLSVPELLVLAQALDIAPVLLLFPLGTEESTEISPGESLPTWDAVQWFSGRSGLVKTPSGGMRPQTPPRRECGQHVYPLNVPEPVAMFEHHDLIVNGLLSKLPPHSVIDDKTGLVLWSSEEDRKDIAGLQSHRGWMRERGLEPPALPLELAHIEADRK